MVSEIQLGFTPDGAPVTLPLGAVTETFAILAKRGAGKTNTAVVLTEELVSAGEQVIVVDPVGVWWGLRATAAGAPSKLPVVIVGGDHADLPLDEADGRALARLLVETRQSAVLDLSALSKSASRRLMADFLEDLYTACRQPTHLVVDEADLLAPQRLPRDMTRLAGAMDDVTRRGRAHGIGVTLISQRPAVLNKDVLGQAEVLITLRMTNPRDVAAIDEWVRLHAADDRAREVKASLPSLPVGTAWLWSPGWLDMLEKIQVRARRTFDSSATPVPGQQRRAPAIARLDVQALRARLADLTGTPVTTAATGPAKTETAAPAALKRIRELEAELRELKTEVEALRQDKADLEQSREAAADTLHQMLRELQPSRPLEPAPADDAPTTPVRSTPQRTEPDSPTTNGTDGPRLRSGAARMLATLARYAPRRLSRAQLATLAKMRATGGTFGTYLSDLRRNGYIAERDGLIEITTAGRGHIGAAPTAIPRSAEQTREQWRTTLRAGARRMFDLITAAYPGGLSRAELAAAAEIELAGGTFGTYLSDLRRNGLITESDGVVTATEILFQEPT